MEQIFFNRNIQSVKDIHHYLNTTDADILDPLLLDNMDKGARMLARHIAQGDEIFIQVDSDADGFTSAALLINYINSIFPHFAQTKIHYRLHDGKHHGLIYDAIPDSVKLVIAPDSSSSEYDIHEDLSHRDIDVLVLDHHLSEKESPYACVINNQLSDNYPNKTLTGVGVVYKFCCYFDSIMNTDYANNFLDLVAIGQVADMADLRPYETHHLISLGISNIKNGFIKGMVAANSFTIQGQLNPHKIAFYIAPYINAINRMGTQNEKLTLFESMLDFKGNELIPSTKLGCKNQTETRIEQACRNCTNTKNRQTKARDASLEIIEQDIESKGLLNNKILVITQQSLNRELAGLTANILAAKYQRPTLVLIPGEENGTKAWSGSARGYGLSNFKSFLSELPGVLLAEGHEQAFGVAIEASALNKFIAMTNCILKDYDFTPRYKVDFVYDLFTLRSDDILTIGRYKDLWGQGLEEPQIVIKNIKVNETNVKILKGNTLKITLPDNISMIKFRATDEECEELTSSGYVIINVVGTCQINEWNGNEFPQIKIDDYEIVKRAIYDF